MDDGWAVFDVLSRNLFFVEMNLWELHGEETTTVDPQLKFGEDASCKSVFKIGTPLKVLIQNGSALKYWEKKILTFFGCHPTSCVVDSFRNPMITTSGVGWMVLKSLEKQVGFQRPVPQLVSLPRRISTVSGFILGSATVVYPPPKKEKAEFFRGGFFLVPKLVKQIKKDRMVSYI